MFEAEHGSIKKNELSLQYIHYFRHILSALVVEIL